MFGIGTPELILVLIIVLILFGGNKLPELSKGIGEVIRNIRLGFSDVDYKKKVVSPKKSAEKNR